MGSLASLPSPRPRGEDLTNESHALPKDGIRVLHLISGLHVGGAGRLMLRNIALLEPEGVKSFVCSLTPRDDLRTHFIEAGFPPLCLDHRTRMHVVRTVRRLVGLIRELEIDVVHTNLTLDSNYGRLAGALAGRPVVSTLHDADKPGPLSVNRGVPVVRPKTFLEDLLARWLTARFVAISAAVRGHYVENHLVPSDRVEVIHLPLDGEGILSQMSAPAAEQLRGELSLRDCYPVLINVARLHPIKDQPLLIESIRLLVARWPSARLLIVGEGEMRPRLEALVTQTGMQRHVTLLGQRHDVPALLALSDMFVLSSSSEGLSYSILEAMAASKPVVATRVGGVPEVVQDGVTGYLVNSGDHVAFADAVSRLAADPQVRAQMGAKAREVVRERFDPQKAAERLRRVYEAAVAQPRTKPE